MQSRGPNRPLPRRRSTRPPRCINNRQQRKAQLVRESHAPPSRRRQMPWADELSGILKVSVLTNHDAANAPPKDARATVTGAGVQQHHVMCSCGQELREPGRPPRYVNEGRRPTPCPPRPLEAPQRKHPPTGLPTREGEPARSYDEVPCRA